MVGGMDEGIKRWVHMQGDIKTENLAEKEARKTG